MVEEEGDCVERGIIGKFGDAIMAVLGADTAEPPTFSNGDLLPSTCTGMRPAHWADQLPPAGAAMKRDGSKAFLKQEIAEARKAVSALETAVTKALSFREKSSRLLEEADRALSRLERVGSHMHASVTLRRMDHVSPCTWPACGLHAYLHANQQRWHPSDV